MRNLIATLLIALSLPVFAASLQQAIDDCRIINNPSERLACYDELSTLTPVADSSSERTQQTIQEPTERSDNDSLVTNFTDKFADFFGFEEKEIAKRIPDSMDVFVKSVSSGNGKLMIRLENGQVWEQIDSKYFRYREDNGQAYIQKGALGSFFFSQRDTKTRIRVRRQQ